MSLSPSPYGIFSAWLRLDNDTNSSFIFSVQNGFTAPPTATFNVTYDLNTYGFELIVTPPFSFVGISCGPVTADGLFHHLLFSYDMSGVTPVALMYFDDVQFTPFFVTGSSVLYPWGPDILKIGIFGREPYASFFFNGCCQNMYINTNEYLDFSIMSNRRKFISATLEPVNLGTNGQLPTGNVPNFFFYGDFVNFPINYGTEGDPLLVGTFVDCPEIMPAWFESHEYQGNGGSPQLVWEFAPFFDTTGAPVPVFFAGLWYTGGAARLVRIDNQTTDWGNIEFVPGVQGTTTLRSLQGSGFDALYWTVSNAGDIDVYESLDGASSSLITTITGQYIASSSFAHEPTLGTYFVYLGTSPGIDSPQIWAYDLQLLTWANVQSFGTTRYEVSDFEYFTNTSSPSGAIYAAVSGTSGNFAQLWKKTSHLTTSPWTLAHTFSRQYISGLAIFPSEGKMYAALYDLGGPREVYSNDATNNDTTWTLEFTFPVGDPGSRLGPVHYGTHPDTGDLLFVGLGNDSGNLDAKIYQYDGITWSLNVDFNVDFPNGSPTITAIGTDTNSLVPKFYAATGDFTLNHSTSVFIYTFPVADAP